MPRLVLLLLAFAVCAPAAGKKLLFETPYVDVVGPDSDIFVGLAMADCKSVQINNAPAKTPKGFSISPEQALAIALHAVMVDCDEQTSTYMYEDGTTYTVFSTRVNAEGYALSSAQIDGRTGKLLKTKKDQLHYPKGEEGKAGKK